ncbi:MAG: PilZ domain-containing protein [Sphingomicrobium sp.]
MDESSSSQNRRSRRSHVLMSASIEAAGLTVPVKLRNLSTEGALIEGDRLPIVGSDVLFHKNELHLSGHVAWVTGRRAGIAFDAMLDPDAVMRHIPNPRPLARLNFRRPRIKSGELQPGERKVAEDWIWGTPIPSIDS